MARLLLFLPLCSFAAPSYPYELIVPGDDQAQLVDGPSLPDPVAFLEKCLARYDREVHGYSCILWKQERIDGRLNPPEKLQVFFRERPYSVLLRWLVGARQAQCVLYVQGQNNDKLLALPAGLLAHLGVFEKSPTGPEAKQSGRYPITEFGIRRGMERTLKSWQPARAEGALHVEYLGLYRVPLAGDRECYKLHRTRYARPENDGVTELTAYIDRETWLQVGTVLRGAEGQLIGEYFFQDIHLNPQFAPHQFDRSALKP
jgi:hypothetical protein